MTPLALGAPTPGAAWGVFARLGSDSGAPASNTMSVDLRVHVIPAVTEMLADSTRSRPFSSRPPSVQRGDGYSEVLRNLGCGGERPTGREPVR